MIIILYVKAPVRFTPGLPSGFVSVLRDVVLAETGDSSDDCTSD